MNSITEILQKFGIESVDLIKSNITRAGQNASGQTAESIKWQTPTETHLLVDAARHIYALETGRGPRKSSQSANLKGKIESWILAKGITFTGKIETAAKGITWCINKYGTKLFREGGRTDIITPALADGRFKKLEDQIADVAVGAVLKSIDPYVSKK